MIARLFSEHSPLSQVETQDDLDLQAFQRIRQNEGFPFIESKDLSKYWAAFAQGKLLAIDRSPQKLHRLFFSEGITMIRLDGKEKLRQLASGIQDSETLR